jgi:hypothetical protein
VVIVEKTPSQVVAENLVSGGSTGIETEQVVCNADEKKE